MLEVVRRDLRVTRPFWAAAVFVFALVLTLGVGRPEAFTGLALALTSGLALVPLFLDDRSRMEPFLAALPLPRREVVFGRYVSAGAAAVAGGILTFGLALALTALGGDRARPLRGFFTPGFALEFSGAVAVSLAIFLPFYFRNGLGKALVRFGAFLLAVWIVSGVAASGILNLMGKSADPLGSPAALAVLGIQAIRDRWGSAAALWAPRVGAAVAVAALVLVSYRLSVRAFARRDL